LGGADEVYKFFVSLRFKIQLHFLHVVLPVGGHHAFLQVFLYVILARALDSALF